jgi:hypothetical protein
MDVNSLLGSDTFIALVARNTSLKMLLLFCKPASQIFEMCCVLFVWQTIDAHSSMALYAIISCRVEPYKYRSMQLARIMNH